MNCKQACQTRDLVSVERSRTIQSVFDDMNTYNYNPIVELDFICGLSTEIHKVTLDPDNLSYIFTRSCSEGNLELLKKLSLSGCKDTNIGLIMACNNEHRDIVEYLLKNNEYDLSVKMYCAKKSPNHVTRLLCESVGDNMFNEEFDFIVDIMTNTRSDIIPKPEYSRFSLYYAFLSCCKEGFLESINTLYAMGVRDKNVGLLKACLSNRYRVVDFLLNNHDYDMSVRLYMVKQAVIHKLDHALLILCKYTDISTMFNELFEITREKLYIDIAKILCTASNYGPSMFDTACENNDITLVMWCYNIGLFDPSKLAHNFWNSYVKGNFDLAKKLYMIDERLLTKCLFDTELINTPKSSECKNRLVDKINNEYQKSNKSNTTIFYDAYFN